MFALMALANEYTATGRIRFPNELYERSRVLRPLFVFSALPRASAPALPRVRVVGWVSERREVR